MDWHCIGLLGSAAASRMWESFSLINDRINNNTPHRLSRTREDDSTILLRDDYCNIVCRGQTKSYTLTGYWRPTVKHTL